MVAGQDVLSRSLDVAALNTVQTRLEALETGRCSNHAQTLRTVLELHRIHRLAGLELNTIAQAALSLGCSEHRAQELLDEALLLLPLPGVFEALECGLLTVEQSTKLVRQLEPLPLEHRLGVWELLQARLIADAASGSVLPPERLSELLRSWVITADPAAAEQRRKQAERGRQVDYRRREDGLTDLFLLGLTGPDAQGVLSSIRRHAEPFGPEDDRTPDQRRLDAAKDLLLGRTPFVFYEQQGHCRPGCDCRPGQPAPCGADVTLLVPLGAALGTTDELAELAGHGPIEPDLLSDLLLASPLLRAVFVDEHGTPVADSPQKERPPRNDPAAVREAILRLAQSPPGPWRPRHPGDHEPPDPDPRDGSPPTEPPPEPAPSGPAGPPLGADLTLLGQIRDRARAAAEAARPVLLAHAHAAGTPGAYRPSRRLARFLRARAPRCGWPGCGARAARCDLDHDLAWPDGPTCPCNIGPLCRRHHRVKQNGWAKLRARDSSVRWTSPTGRTWTSPNQHQPPAPPVRPLPKLAPPQSPLDQLSSLQLEHELWALDPGSPLWDDPAGLELRAEDLEPHQVDPDPPRDTRWSLDLDDPYAWLDLAELIIRAQLSAGRGAGASEITARSAPPPAPPPARRRAGRAAGVVRRRAAAPPRAPSSR